MELPLYHDTRKRKHSDEHQGGGGRGRGCCTMLLRPTSLLLLLGAALFIIVQMASFGMISKSRVVDEHGRPLEEVLDALLADDDDQTGPLRVRSAEEQLEHEQHIIDRMVATDQLFDEGLSQKQQSEKNAEAKAKVQAIIAEERAKAEAEANVAEEAAAQAVRAEQAEREALAAKQAADDAAAQAEEAASIAAARAKEAAAVAATAEDIVEEKRREEEQAAMELEAMKEAIAAPRIGPNGEDRSDPHDRDTNGAGRKDDLVPQSDRKHSVESIDGAGVGGGGAGAGAGAGKRRIAVDLGVAPEDSAVYLAEGRFTCADGSKAVDRSAVNDDFCDCPDGSDEPGTSACHGTSNFYCASEGRHLRALEVNDGVCDCCDGSDEWEKRVACADTCGALRKKAEAAKAAAARGSKIKQDYIMRGEEAQQKGKAGTAVPPAFWPLTERCYKKKQSEYLYELCFFKSVTQSKGRKERTDLGKKWRWTVDGKAGTFSHGKQCPGGPDRETRVEFECGEADAFVSIAESERCIYTAKFTTPAACD